MSNGRIDVRQLTDTELAELRDMIGNGWPAGAQLIEAIGWSAQGMLFQKVTIETTAPPQSRIWIAESAPKRAATFTTRPATAAELDKVLSALREVGAGDIAQPIVEAHCTPKSDSFQLSFVRLADMVEGTPYKRWHIQFHADHLPSISYLLETRRGGWFKTLPGGRVLRSRWSAENS